jgi:LPXTG-motif cell wall-anchored protein
VLDVTGGPAAVPAPGAMALFAAGDEYRVDPTQLTGPANGVVWAVLVAPIELPPVDPGTLPGTDVDPGAGLPAAGPAAAPRVLPATGSDMDPLVLMLGAGLLIAAGLGTRLVVRRRNS